jgi:hypothetical protein
MRFLPCSFVLVALCALSLAGQQRSPIPPGEVKAAQAINSPLEGPRQPHRMGISPAELEQESQTLASLASTVKGQLDAAAKGEMPKDLPKNLKDIEKLVKRIHSQLFD